MGLSEIIEQIRIRRLGFEHRVEQWNRLAGLPCPQVGQAKPGGDFHVAGLFLIRLFQLAGGFPGAAQLQKIESQQAVNPLQLGLEFERLGERLDRLWKPLLLMTNQAEIEVQFRQLLKELFSDRPVTPSWTETYMARTNDLTSRADNPFSIMIGGNFGISRGFFWSVGGNDESFMRWGVGLEDNEFCYRAYTCGGLMVPARDACAWHQGNWEEGRAARRRIRRILLGKAANLIAHDSLRKSRPGRIFMVPQYVVTIDAGHHSVDQIVSTAGSILADRVHDLVVRIEMRANDDDERLARLQDEFGSDPRVRVGLTTSALDEFPASPFHVTVPAVLFAQDLVRRLRIELGDAVTVTSTLPDGSMVSITRAWALHRARRTGKSAADFGEARTIPARALKLKGAPGRWILPQMWERLLDRTRDVRSLGEAWSFLKWLAGSLLRRAISQLG